MKKARFDLNHGAESSPGVNVGGVPDGLLTAIRDLLPELLPHKELMDKMNRFIFPQQEGSGAELFEEIQKEMEQISGKNGLETKEFFITILVGMRASAEENHLVTPDDLNGYLENNKQSFKNNHWDLFAGLNGLNNDNYDNYEEPGMDPRSHPLQKRK
jgi:hypothetical protein